MYAEEKHDFQSRFQEISKDVCFEPEKHLKIILHTFSLCALTSFKGIKSYEMQKKNDVIQLYIQERDVLRFQI